MADRAAKQPRQSDFDRMTFIQPPPKPASEPVMPIDLLIPRPAPAETSEPVEELKQSQKSEPRAPRSKPSPAPDAKPGEDKEPPKEKITVMLPAAMAERLKDVVYWDRITVAALVEQGLNVVLADRERKNGGPYKRREAELTRGRPVGTVKLMRKTQA